MEGIKLTKVKIKEYKSIYETDLNINDRIIVIAGKNESGKTNILKALKDGIQDKFDDDCKPLGLEKTNPTLEMEFEFTGEYLNEKYNKKIFKNKETYMFDIVRSMNVIDKVSGSLVEEIKEYIKKEISKIVENDSEVINLFSNLKSDIHFEGEKGKKYVIEYISYYFVNQLFYNGDKEDLPFVTDLQSKIQEDADGNEIEFENIEKLVNNIEEKFKEQKEFIDNINNKSILCDFIYFSSFDDMLPDEIDYLELEKEEYQKNNKGFINLLNYLNISVEEFLKKMNEDVRNVQNYLRNLSTKMTGNFSDIYTQETIELSLQKDGSKIVINIFDKNDKDYSKKPSQRSQGFQWFLAFYLVLNSKNCKENTILLIDEPGLFLHVYKNFPNILHSLNAKSNRLLLWTHYKTLLQVFDNEARNWYEQEAIQQTWSVRTLQRNISSQYYYRLLKSQVKEPVIEEMKKVNEDHYLMNKLEFIKNPVIAEFLGYSLDDSFTETELESSIINNLQKFLMELQKRICFCCKTTAYSN